MSAIRSHPIFSRFANAITNIEKVPKSSKRRHIDNQSIFTFNHHPGSIGCANEVIAETHSVDAVPLVDWVFDPEFFARVSTNHVHTSISIVDQYIQTSIIFRFDSLKEFFDFIIFGMIYGNCHSFASPFFNFLSTFLQFVNGSTSDVNCCSSLSKLNGDSATNAFTGSSDNTNSTCH